MGNKDHTDFSLLEKFGPVSLLTDEMVFADKSV
jgi:hypothetical protein